MPGHRKRRQFKQTDAFTRGMVIGLKRAGWSLRQIAADTHLGASTVHRLWRRWLEQGNVAIYRNAGATRVTSARVDRRILQQAVAAPQATCTAILQHVQDTLDHSISTRTISRRLVANGLHSCRPLRRLPLTPPNRRQRLEWCRARSTWMTEWHRVVFSDESRFCLSSDSRRVRVWRRRGESSNPAAIVERPTVRQRGIMVWGAIAYDSRSPLLRIHGTMTAQRYVDDVLRPVTLPYLQGVPNALYQQDNARPHTARISQQALQDVQMLPWPPYSPDLSPIEHVWDIIGRRLHALPQPRSEDELWQMVEREWRAIPQDAIRTLIDSLPRRVAACIAVRGRLYALGLTKVARLAFALGKSCEVHVGIPGNELADSLAKSGGLGHPEVRQSTTLLEISSVPPMPTRMDIYRNTQLVQNRWDKLQVCPLKETAVLVFQTGVWSSTDLPEWLQERPPGKIIVSGYPRQSRVSFDFVKSSKFAKGRAERKLKLFINNSQITHSEHPKYLGIHLDRTLTFKTHLTKLKGKLSSRNNILHKLAGSSWGSDANTLRTSALALIFSTAEYCAPVWEGSCHTKLIDTQLNSTLRIITGVCQPTRIDWLPVLAHISPPELRRKEATKKMYQKLLDSPDLEINPILQSPPKHRLKSRNPIWSRGNQLLSQNFNISEAWTNSWISSDIPNKNLITSPSVKIPGFSLPRREWVLLNRFRTGQGRCAELMKLWGYTKDPNCACNVPQSMSHILDDCPLYKFNGGISNLHSVTPEALNWLKALPLRL
ncbi:hypothetical protein LAZ67_14000409 [Cordylochernes scorpioides]|uniref:Uncharacterized protein n=1 Tax=Cordylochernes scorpioides TaxID=51811 RepID=A0ABY6L5M0_9ARAC|nr:hypothetical protein LAZ67_14000409 [Cordylochernes scorpioides]